MSWKNRIPWLLILILVLGFYVTHHRIVSFIPARIERPEKTQRDEASAPSHPLPSTPRRDIASSQNTAQAEPSVATSQAPLATMMRRDFTDLAVTEYPDGRKSIHLGGRFQHVTSLVTLSNGQTIPKCFSSYDVMLKETEKIQTPSNDEPIAPNADF